MKSNLRKTLRARALTSSGRSAREVNEGDGKILTFGSSVVVGRTPFFPAEEIDSVSFLTILTTNGGVLS